MLVETGDAEYAFMALSQMSWEERRELLAAMSPGDRAWVMQEFCTEFLPLLESEDCEGEGSAAGVLSVPPAVSATGQVRAVDVVRAAAAGPARRG